MLKSLLLSGWFRVQPFLKYVVVVMLIAPLAAASSHATSATRSEVASTSAIAEAISAPVEATGVTESAVNPEWHQNQNSSPVAEFDSKSTKVAAVVEPQLLGPVDNYLPEAESNSEASQSPAKDPLATVELAPQLEKYSSLSENTAESQSDLISRLKAAKGNSLIAEQGSVYMAKVVPGLRESRPSEPEVAPGQPDAAMQQASEDPLGSSYPIPMKWITATQEAMAPKGGGVRYYRSVPVNSPDGRYAVYSRIQLEVKPDTHNSRVSSVMFIEDRKTKQMRVLTSTSRNSDALIQVKAAPDANGEGTMGILVPVSWSEKGDRFLARRFEGIMNTSDVSDYAVIWHRDKNHTNTVGPAHQEDDHEKISILLGWSKSQPNHVLFRAGEMGEENWSLLTVSDEGKTANANEVDQPVTFGTQAVNVWAGPQVAYR